MKSTSAGRNPANSMLNLLKRSHDDRPSRPRVERTVHRVRHKQFRLERLRPIYPTRPTEFKRWFSSQSSRSGSPFICAPPPASTTLLVSSFRIYARLPREESPPRRTSECTRESCPATPVRHPASYSASVRLRPWFPSSSPPEGNTRPCRDEPPGCPGACRRSIPTEEDWK